MELEKDAAIEPGISILHYQNPESGLNDVTMIVFDLRLFQKEIEEMGPTLADALGNIGIVQPTPHISAAANAMSVQQVPQVAEQVQALPEQPSEQLGIQLQ